MTKFEELTEKKSALEALVPDIEADNEEAIAQGAELKSAIETLEAEIKAEEEKASILDMVGEDSHMEEVKMNEMELFVKNASFYKFYMFCYGCMQNMFYICNEFR
jgi:hypothetical protein